MPIHPALLLSPCPRPSPVKCPVWWARVVPAVPRPAQCLRTISAAPAVSAESLPFLPISRHQARCKNAGELLQLPEAQIWDVGSDAGDHRGLTEDEL